MADNKHHGPARTEMERVDETPIGATLADARRRLADTATALRTGSPDAADVSAVIAGTHELTTTLASLVQTLMDHTETLADQHDPQVSNEIHADLQALHGCLTTGALLLAPALDDLAPTGADRNRKNPRREDPQ